MARVVRRFDAPATAVWEYVSWNGMVKLAGSGLFEKVEFEGGGTRIGSIKTLHIGQSLPIRERLEALDESGMSYVYRIVDNGPLPITNYRGEVRVTPCGPKACVLVIAHEFIAVGIDESEWIRSWQVMENGLLDQIQARLAGGE
jgi:hypothetical protein